MIEVYGDLWTYPADARVITTNGTIKNDGTAVMGRGCARELKDAEPGIDKRLGQLLERHGNHVFEIGTIKGCFIYSFPVKRHWREKADLHLITQSAYQLRTIVTALDFDQVVVPRPGCGNGGLDWEGFAGVKFQLMNKWDDRFHVITQAR